MMVSLILLLVANLLVMVAKSFLLWLLLFDFVFDGVVFLLLTIVSVGGSRSCSLLC